MSLSGRRPTSVSSLSSRNRLPSLGPRRTTSSAVLGGSVSTAAASATLWSTGSGSGGSTPVKIIEVVSPKLPRSGVLARGDPPNPPAACLVSGVAHCEQNRALSVFSAPQAGQTIPPDPPAPDPPRPIPPAI